MDFHIDKARFLPKDNVYKFLTGLKNFGKLIAPIKKREKFYFEDIGDVSDVILDYVRTVLPPKKYLLPYKRERLSYDTNTFEIKQDFKPENQVIFGLHSCDLHGITILDKILLSEPIDSRYLKTREKTLLIGISCKPDEHCFCLATGTAFPDGANWDLFLTDIGYGYFISIGSTKGDEVLYSMRKLTRKIESKDLQLYKKVTAEKKYLFKKENLPDLERISSVIELEYDSEVWEKASSRCFGCGTCTNVCPTCYCYSSVDIPSIDGKNVRRTELATSCQYPYYSLVAGGHYFLPDRKHRFRHRYYHKFVGYPYQIGKLGCVGCGRCTVECPAKIDMVRVLKKLRGNEDEKGLRENVRKADTKKPL